MPQLAARRSRFITLFLLVLALPLLAQAEIAVRDDSGQLLRLARPVRRIVSLAPHATENLYAAGAGDRLVGTVEYSDYPAAAMTLPRVGSYARVDLEAVLRLQPDLIVVWQSGNDAVQIDKIKVFGVPMYVSQPNRVDDVAAELLRFGQLTGSTATAQVAAAQFTERLRKLRATYSHKPTVRTFYQLTEPPIYTVGGPQIISNAIHLCSGENIFAGLSKMAPTVTAEAVLAANPEAIVASRREAGRPTWLDDWKRWPQLLAVARDNLFAVPADLLHRHTPRFLDGTELLCQQLDIARSRRTAPLGPASRP